MDYIVSSGGLHWSGPADDVPDAVRKAHIQRRIKGRLNRVRLHVHRRCIRRPKTEIEYGYDAYCGPVR